jgi:methionyl-tRNA formyltransferase
MQMEAGLDTGPMLLKREMPVDRLNAGELTEALAKLGAEAMIDWLSNPERFPPELQPESRVTYAAKVDKAEARIDWNDPAIDVERQVRAFEPKPGAWFEFDGERVKILAADAIEASGAPGEVLDDRLTIACGEGALRPVTVQRPGRGSMSPAEMLRGFVIPVGTTLG